MAPEIINIKDMSTKSDAISDVFSVGLIFHYLLFGESAFQGRTHSEILSQNRICEFYFDGGRYDDMCPVAMDLMKRMLEKDPMRRISAS